MFLTSFMVSIWYPVYKRRSHDQDLFCPCCCRREIVLDVYGDHAVTCPSGQVTATTRHNATRDALFDFFERSALETENEKRGLLRDGTASKPGDLVVQGWNIALGDGTCFDVTFVCPVSPSVINASVSHPGSAMENKAQTKITKYKQQCLDNQFDSFGAASPSTLAVLRQLANYYASHNMCKVDYATTIIHQRISSVVQKANGRIFAARDRLLPA